MPIYVEVPDGLQFLADALKDVVASVVAQRSKSPRGGTVDYGLYEDELGSRTAAVERAGHTAVLQALDVDAPTVVIDGARYSRAGRFPGTYYTMAGAVEVERTLYRRRGESGTVDAIGVRIGAVGSVGDRWLPKTAQAMSHEVQKATTREAEQSGKELHRLPYSHTAFHRVAQLVGEQFVVQRQDIEEVLIEELEVPDEAHSICASLDRVSIPLEEDRPRPEGRPKKNAPKRPVARVFRMAYCGTVSLCNAAGEVIHTIRYGRMPSGDPKELCEGMAADALVLLRKKPDLHIQLLNDGAHEMWNLMTSAFSATVFGQKPHENLDFHHLVEKLGKAAGVVAGDGGTALTDRWSLMLLNRSDAAARILDELERSGCEQTRVADERPVHDAITYLRNHAARLDYAEARRLGLPIGSGPVEATCKSLFNIRMKRSGARWREESGENVMQLRALALSDRWAPAIRLTLAPLRRSVRRAA